LTSRTNRQQIDRLLFQDDCRAAIRLFGFAGAGAGCVGLYGLLSYEFRGAPAKSNSHGSGRASGSVLKLVYGRNCAGDSRSSRRHRRGRWGATRYLTSCSTTSTPTIPKMIAVALLLTLSGARRKLHPGSPGNACRSPGGPEIRVVQFARGTWRSRPIAPSINAFYLRLWRFLEAGAVFPRCAGAWSFATGLRAPAFLSPHVCVCFGRGMFMLGSVAHGRRGVCFVGAF